MKIDVRNIKVKIGQKEILNNISFSTDKTLAIIGPSGSGKTTLLRCVAGLQKYSGSIYFNDQCLDNVPTQKRNMGFVSQDLSLFPHLSVFENIAFPLKVRKLSKSEISKKVNNILLKFQIKKLAKFLPQQVSGGEQQRAALARAMIYNPNLLLLDEPFAQLDTLLKCDLLIWLKNVLVETEVLALFVTHNLKEAKFISDNYLFLDKGRVQDNKSKMVKEFLNKGI